MRANLAGAEWLACLSHVSLALGRRTEDGTNFAIATKIESPMNRTHRLLAAAAIATLAQFAVADSAESGKGLDALTDDRLMNDLAGRNLKVLLDREFEINKTPAEQKKAVLGRMALLRLQSDKLIGLLDVRKLVAEYVASLSQILPTMNDPTALLNDANVLIDNGITSDANLIEYFGASPGPMQRLHPVANAVRQMLAQAQVKADEIATKAANNWPAMEKVYDKADQQKTIAEYTKNIITFPLALSTEQSDPARDKLIGESIDYLSQFDAEENPDRAAVKYYLGQLNVARGTPESLKAALDYLTFVAKNGKASDQHQQFDSRFLLASANIELKDTVKAAQAVDALAAYAKGAGIPPEQSDVAVSALQYRIALAQNQGGKADDILDQLQQKHAELRGLILELMSARVKSDAPIASLNKLLLQALLAKAETETVKPADQAFDKDAVQRGIDAAKELLQRGGTTDADKTLVDNVRYVLPFFQQKADQKVEAAKGFLDFVDAHKAEKNADGKNDRAETAFNNAISLVGTLYHTSPAEPETTSLYDRVLATAVAPPFSRSEFAYEYARRLQANGKFDQAIEMFRKVPADDRNYAESQYYLMVATRQSLDKVKDGEPKHAALLTDLTKLIDSVNQSMANKLAAEQNPKLKTVEQMRLAQTQLLGGDVALHDQKDAGRAVQMLSTFEETAKGLPNENDLLGEVLLIRVQGYVQLGKVSEATDQLVRLAKQNPNGAGQIVFNLLKKLDEQVTEAEAAGHKDVVAGLERNRALLTPFLVTWAGNHPNPEIKKLTYTYSVFDADTQRRAADLTADLGKKQQLMDASLKRFQELATPESVKKYAATLPPEKQAKAKYDPQVLVGLGRVYFEKGDWANARLQYVQLFRDKVLGTGSLTVSNPAGGFDTKDNPSFWEAMYRLIRCNLNLNENVDGMKSLIQEQMLIYGDDLGGQRWKTEFDAIKKELQITPTAPATSQPAQ